MRRGAVFAIAAAVVAYLGFENGGYDLVTRQRFALAVWVAIGLGFAFGVLPRSQPPRLALVALALGCAYLAWTTLSLAWTASDERTLAEVARLLGYLGVVTLALTGLNRHTFRAAAAGVSIAAATVICCAIASRLFPGEFPGATDVARVFRADRLDFPLDYWNAVGAWGAMSVAIGLAWSAHGGRALTRSLGLALVPVAGLAVYLTYSRGGAIASAVAVIAVLAASHNRWTALIHALAGAAGTAAAILVVRGQPEIAEATGGAGAGAVLAALVVAALACAGVALLTTYARTDRLRLAPQTAAPATAALLATVVIGAALFANGPISRAWDQYRNEEQVAAGADPAQRLTTAGGKRNDLWSSALEAFETHPLDGIGPGTFEWWWSGEGRDAEFVRDAHSLYLENLAELGLPGLLLLAGFLACLLAVAVGSRRSQTAPGDLGAATAMICAFAVFLVSAGLDWMWEETAVTVLALGGAAVAAAGQSGRMRRSARRSPIARPGVRAAIVALALLAAAVEVPGLVSAERIRDSQAAAQAGDLAASADFARQALDAAPWAAGPHEQLALVREAQGRYEEGRSEIREAIEKEPDNWRYPLILARIELADGNRDVAREVYEAGRRLRPLSPSYSPLSPFGLRLYTRRQLERIFAPREGSP